MFLAMSTGFSSRLGGVRWDLGSDMSRKWDLEAPGRERPDTFAEIQRSPLACSDANRMVLILRNRASAISPPGKHLCTSIVVLRGFLALQI